MSLPFICSIEGDGGGDNDERQNKWLQTAFELAVALKVPKWFIQFEYIKRLIKTGKELYAEEELRLDFKSMRV